MNLIVVGLSHKTAPVEVRERLAFKATQLGEVCRQVTDQSAADEVMILSTCNRVEVYAVAPNVDDGFATVSAFLSRCADGMDVKALGPHLYHYPGNDAIGHMFRVASSLDSMVLGEPQILGQFKDAFEAALNAKSTGMVLNKIAKKAISVAKRVRTETKIAENAVSISYAAVELARKVFADLHHQRVMLLGAGEMAELALRHLISAGVREVVLSTRTTENAHKLAEALCAEGGPPVRVVPFADYAAILPEVDIVLCSTGAPDYVIGPKQVSAALRARGHRPMFLIDISVPRNIDPATAHVGDAYVYDIDDLQSVVEANLEERQAEARKAMVIIDEEVDTTARWIRSLEVVPTITALKGHAEAIARGEVERVLNRLPNLGEKERKLIEGLGPAIINKLLHNPLSSLRKEAQERGGRDMVETTRKLFALPDEGAAGDAPAGGDDE
ncbi:MAG: glutamyl-tRNA reductase [Nitrospirae bacterium]|nr:glutamyl-tRNA reductase [Nitrospirota bacterium]